MAEEEDQAAELVMPFLPVQSRGGPFDDDAYVAGFEMGLLDMQLAQQPVVELPDRPIHAENAEQADLIAMRHGYRAVFEWLGVDGWTHLRIVRDQGGARRG